MAEPIWMTCPGSGCPGNDLGERLVGALSGVVQHEMRHCAYCDAIAVTPDDGILPVHETKDILAMIDRGDFDG
jgi:hypothetical protein